MNPKWDRRFLEMARLVSSWSKDPSTKIGVVLVKDRKVVATGYNGFPTGIADDDRLDDRERKYALVVHAEMNALLQAGRDAEGSTLYLWGFSGCPCQNCTKHIIQAGVKKVVYYDGPTPPERWAAELEAARNTLGEASVEVKKAGPWN
jgi:dCMP deaminase